MRVLGIMMRVTFEDDVGRRLGAQDGGKDAGISDSLLTSQRGILREDGNTLTQERGFVSSSRAKLSCIVSKSGVSPSLGSTCGE